MSKNEIKRLPDVFDCLNLKTLNVMKCPLEVPTVGPCLGSYGCLRGGGRFLISVSYHGTGAILAFLGRWGV